MPKNKDTYRKLRIGCDSCYHKGYIVEKKNNFSRAKICECLVKCELCVGRGSIISKNESGYSTIASCDSCGVIHRNVKLYNLAGIPAKYSHVLQVDTFQPRDKTEQEALSYAKDFVQLYPNKRGFLLMGAAGRGKTHLAIGAISEITLERGVRCLFKDFFFLLSELKEAYSMGTPENEVLRPLIETEVLVIDELGKAKSNEWELNILDQLISKRYNASKTTLVTTNFISSDFAKSAEHENRDILDERVGSRIISRLHEMCKFIYLKGRDFREQSKNI